jgi:anthranilate/para-aminobenzoate synthase component II
MQEKLRKLYNTMANIETKGENTKIMGVCLQYLEQLMAEVEAEAVEPAAAPKTKSKKAE